MSKSKQGSIGINLHVDPVSIKAVEAGIMAILKAGRGDSVTIEALNVLAKSATISHSVLSNNNITMAQ